MDSDNSTEENAMVLLNSPKIQKAFLDSCLHGISKNVEILISEGIDVNTASPDMNDGVEYNNNGLLLAVTGFGNALFNNQSPDEYEKVITLLLESGIDVYSTNSIGFSVEFMLETMDRLGPRAKRMRKLITGYYKRDDDGRILPPYKVTLTDREQEIYDSRRIHFKANSYIKNETINKKLRFLLLILLDGTPEQVGNYFSDSNNPKPTIDDLKLMLECITPDDYVERTRLADAEDGEIYDCYARQCIKFWIDKLKKLESKKESKKDVKVEDKKD